MAEYTAEETTKWETRIRATTRNSRAGRGRMEWARVDNSRSLDRPLKREPSNKAIVQVRAVRVVRRADIPVAARRVVSRAGNTNYVVGVDRQMFGPPLLSQAAFSATSSNVP